MNTAIVGPQRAQTHTVRGLQNRQGGAALRLEGSIPSPLRQRDTARPMSRENVEVIHKLAEAFNRHDLEALSALSDEDAEFISLLTAIEAGGATYRGPNIWVDYFAAMDEAWTEWQVEDLRVFDAGDEQAAAIFRIVGKGRSSGARADQLLGITHRFRGGKLWRMRAYMDPEEALEAVGLRA